MNDLIYTALTNLPLSVDNPLNGLIPDFSFAVLTAGSSDGTTALSSIISKNGCRDR